MGSVEIEVCMKLFQGILQRLGSIESGSNAGGKNLKKSHSKV